MLKQTRPSFWRSTVLLLSLNLRKLRGSGLSSSVNEGSAPTSWASSSGQEPGSSYRWPSNVTANWSDTSRAWSEGGRGRKKEDLVAV